MNAVSLDDRGDWQCPEHGPGTPKRLFGAFLHCMLCGDQCEPRPSVLAAIKHAQRPDVIEPPAVPVRGAPPARNACHNRPDKSPTYLAQDGYCEPFSVPSGEWFKTAKYVEIPHVMSEDCRYDKRDTDSKCAGCRHQRGES
jgi:hypothetical protein